jgi:Ca2+-binding RTX toxin-like protein
MHFLAAPRLGRLALPLAGVAAALALTADADARSTHQPKVDIEFDDGRLKIEGTDAPDKLILRVPAAHPHLLQVDVGDDGRPEAAIRLSKVRSIKVEAEGGHDLVRIDDLPGVTLPLTTMEGGGGNDTLLGGRGVERMLGDGGNDLADGNAGNDAARMGSGDDVFRWDPGDGSDVVEGQSGRDELLFNGANAAEQFSVSANGHRVRYLRDVANITMDLDDVERITTNALGGTDTMTVNDVTGTDLTEITTDYAGAIGGTAGDGAVDRLVVNGTEGADLIDITGDATSTTVSGLKALIRARTTEAQDVLAVNALGGNDKVNASTLPDESMTLAQDGGAGNDELLGGSGVEVQTGGAGHDLVDGNRGNDTGLLGAGDDVFRWDPGDGNDTIEGQDGTDEMLFNGAGIAENIDISANGGRVRFFRDIAAVLMDLNDTERVRFNALGGPDNVVVHDLSGTDAKRIETDLAGALGGATGDGALDRVTVEGTNGNDHMTVVGSNGSATLSGLAAVVALTRAEPADILDVKGLGGADALNSGGLAPGTVDLRFAD